MKKYCIKLNLVDSFYSDVIADSEAQLLSLMLNACLEKYNSTCYKDNTAEVRIEKCERISEDVFQSIIKQPSYDKSSLIKVYGECRSIYFCNNIVNEVFD